MSKLSRVALRYGPVDTLDGEVIAKGQVGYSVLHDNGAVTFIPTDNIAFVTHYSDGKEDEDE